jgi:predicted ATPase
MLKLKFQQKYKSIELFSNPIEFERFSIITGLNGSGKTHLLEAILQHSTQLEVDGQHVDITDVRSFSWQTFDVSQTGPADVSHRISFLSQFWPQVQSIKQSFMERLRVELTNLGASVENADVEPLFVKAGEEFFQVHDTILETLALVNQQIQESLFNYLQVNGSMLLPIDLAALVREHPGLACLSESQFRYKLVNAPLMLDPFRQRLSELFTIYRKSQETNQVNKDPELSSAPPLDASQFEAQNGRAPWKILNEMLANGGYRFQVTFPKGEGPFEVRLNSIDSLESWNFSDLSSGEKVLISFLLASYTFKNGHVTKQVPKVLLLDEVDAPLHPSMIDNLLRVISETLVEGQNVHCIMTTHNPATIALAQTAAIYKMSVDELRISKCTHDEAIQILSTGLPTLSVAVENRRIVWVESDDDVKVMETLTANLKKYITGPFLPTFQSVGFKAVDNIPNSEQSGGKARVKEVVKSLRSVGMLNAWGLIDSDVKGAVETDAGVIRLTNGERYSIENVLLDPLLIGMLFIRERLDCAGLNRKSLGATDQDTWGEVDLTNEAKLQGIVDKVLSITGQPDAVLAISATTKVALLNGIAVDIPNWFLEIRGHDWSKHLFSKLPILLKWKSESGLMTIVAKTVIGDAAGLLSLAAAESIQSLCKK